MGYNYSKTNKILWDINVNEINEKAFEIYLKYVNDFNEKASKYNKYMSYMCLSDFKKNLYYNEYLKEAVIYLRKEKIKKIINGNM